MEGKNREKTITKEIVSYASNLSRISLEKDDAEEFQAQLSRILTYVTQLNEVDTEDTLPTSHVLLSMKNVFREDTVIESFSPEEALSNAPAKKGNFFKVPKIIKDA
ncbi:MAG: Asp-tRNA(Asn)/Glu-tRNA(Gln) amidotransferase subunit GatC [Candidatus Omnitrophota bacterium]